MQTPLEKIIHQIAMANGHSSLEIREKMQQAMEDALANPDPAVQAMWATIPKGGTKPTLEEFMDYLIEKNLLKP